MIHAHQERVDQDQIAHNEHADVVKHTCNQHSLLFPQCFLLGQKNSTINEATFKLLSVNAFYLIKPINFCG